MAKKSSSFVELLTSTFKEPLSVKNVPRFPGYAAVFGPGIVWAGLSQGSGELIWWPYMVTKYGLFFMGWLFIWAMLQYWYNQEIGRYTVATGESIFDGWHRIHHLVGWFMLAMAVVIYSWVGGYTGAAASAMRTITGFPPGWDPVSQGRFWGLVVIFVTWLILVLGPVAYKVVEIVETLAALASFFGMLVAVVATPAVHAIAGEFFISLFTPNFPWTPPGWDAADTGILITMICYTGAGGIWNMAYSYWIRDKNWGQANHIGRVTSPVTGEPEAIPSVGVGFEPTDENLREYSKWTRTLWIDNFFGVIFNWATIILTSMLSYAILRPKYLAGEIEAPKGWSLVVVQGEWLVPVFGEVGRTIMLLLGFFFLFDVFLTAADLFARIVSTNTHINLTGKVQSTGLTWLALFIGLGIFIFPFSYDAEMIASDPVAGYGAIILALAWVAAVAAVMALASTQNWEYRKIYYIIVTAFSIVGGIQLFLRKPSALIVATGVANMYVMAIACWLLLYLNWFLLPKIHPAKEKVRPNWIHFVLLLIISIVFTYCSIWDTTVRFGLA